jgi:AraC-like DNA-binding protein
MDQIAPRFVRLSTDDLPERHRIEAIRDVYGPVIIKHDIEPIAGHPLQFQVSLLKLPDLAVASTVVSPCHCARGPQHIDSDDLLLNISLAGGRIVGQRGREAVVRAGEAVLASAEHTGFVTVPARARFISLRVPRRLLGPAIADLDTSLLRTIPSDTPALRLLTAFVGPIADADVLAVPQLHGFLATCLHDLFALTVGATRDAAEVAAGRGLSAARLRAIKGCIMQSLGDSTLSIGAVAARQRITPRYVRMLFERDGTSFSEFVLGNRLARAHCMLRDPRQAGRTISTIAYECGFGDLSYFGRTFRRQFGATPSDVRHQMRQQGL